MTVSPPRYPRQRIRSKTDAWLIDLASVLFFASIALLAIAGWLGISFRIPAFLWIVSLILVLVSITKSWIDGRKFAQEFKPPPLPESFEESLRKWWRDGTMVAEIPDLPLDYIEPLAKLIDLFGMHDAVTVGRNYHLPNVGMEFGMADKRDQKRVKVLLYRRDLAHARGIKRRPWRVSLKDRTRLQAPEVPMSPDEILSPGEQVTPLPDWIT